jgi:hypothetical protein
MRIVLDGKRLYAEFRLSERELKDLTNGLGEYISSFEGVSHKEVVDTLRRFRTLREKLDLPIRRIEAARRERKRTQKRALKAQKKAAQS